MKPIIFLLFTLWCTYAAAQDTTLRPLTMAEYKKAKTFTVKNLDNDTYVKFENTYVLDRYEMRKPYFVTGDDGLKKRIDLYNLLHKGSTQPLGTVIFYTNEKGKQYTALQPNFAADDKVWAQYFEDIHAIDREEKNFVLKLSYILSKELSFQLHKATNGGKVKIEDATYGSNICFPGNQWVHMANGTRKKLAQVQQGDVILTMNPTTKHTYTVQVKQVVVHQPKNYAVTELLLVNDTKHIGKEGIYITLDAKTITATPNHPIKTNSAYKKIGDVAVGDKLLCLDVHTGSYKTYRVMNKWEKAGGWQKVYSIDLTSGNGLLINDVMLLQK